MLILIVTSGPDKGRIFELFDGDPVVLGRQGHPVPLSDSKVSHRHARLLSEGGFWYVQDLGSQHGTYRNHELIEGKTQLNDGDHLQIGNTALVVARTPRQRAERLALLGDPNREPDATETSNARPASTRWRRAALVGVTVGAGVVVAVSMPNWWTPPGEQGALYHEETILSASPKASKNQPRTSVGEGDVALQAVPPISGQMMADSVPDQEAGSGNRTPDPHTAPFRSNVEDLRELAAVVRSNERALAQLADRLEDQVNQIQSAEELRTFLVKLIGEVHQVLDDRTTRTDALLNELLANVEAKPDTDEVSQSVQEAINERSGQTHKLLEQVLAKIDSEPGIDKLGPALRQALAEQPTSTETRKLKQVLAERSGDIERLIRSVLAEVRAQPDAKKAVEELSNSLAERSRRTDEMLQQFMARNDSDPASGGLELRQMLAEESSQTNQMVEKVLADLQSKPGTDELNQAIRPLLDHHFGQTDGLLQQVLVDLEAKPGADELEQTFLQALGDRSTHDDKTVQGLRRSLAENSRDTERLIRSVLAEVRAQSDAKQAIEQLDARLAERAGRTDQLIRDLQRVIDDQTANTTAKRAIADQKPLIDAISEEVEQLAAEIWSAAKAGTRGRASLDEKLRQIRELVETLPAKTDAHLAEALAALRTELHAILPNDGFAFIYGNRAGLDADGRPAASRANLPRWGEAGPPSGPRHVVPHSPFQSDTFSAAEADAPLNHNRHTTLTETERAYKLAFESNQPVSIGAGIINPSTGEVSEGRTLDPAAAKAVGIKSWRDWYLMDNLAERTRLQTQALQYARDQHSDAAMISFPQEGIHGAAPFGWTRTDQKR